MKKIAALLLLTSIYACNNEKKTEKTIDSATAVVTQTPDSLGYTYKAVKVYGHPTAAKNSLITDTARSIIAYPLFTDKTVNKFVEDRVTSMAGAGMDGKTSVYHTYKQLAEGFIKEFNTYQADNTGSPQPWFQDIDLRVTANYPNYLSILFTLVDYRGGAHPNTLYTYLNYNPNSYQTITLDSLITSDGMPKLRAIAEQIFRKNEKLDAKASLSEGYFFAEGVFALAETFTVTKDGLKFLYNPYEIKPYASGTTELIVPFAEIKDILKPSSTFSTINK